MVTPIYTTTPNNSNNNEEEKKQKQSTMTEFRASCYGKKEEEYQKMSALQFDRSNVPSSG